MRLFIGVKIKNPLTQICQDIIHTLSQQTDTANWQWTVVENLHLTLCFLGELLLPQADACVKQMKTIAQNTAPFSLESEGVVAFPPVPSYLVLMIKPSRELTTLFNQCNELRNNLSLTLLSQTFYPHITLGRSSKEQEAQFAMTQSFSVPTTVQRVTEITLFESVDEQGKRRYKVLRVESL